VDCAFEAIEGVMLPSNDYFKRFVIFIFANFACSHTQIVSRAVAFAAVFAFVFGQEVCDAGRNTRLCELCFGLLGKLSASPTPAASQK
jgi:hypothetical protein